MRSNAIRIRGARVHNLRDVEVALPRHRLIAITGVSGSGKSSLAFDTLFREGQRRFLETLSAYARQFLGRMEKPDVESIEGLSPAIAVDQAAASTSPRSTVGTLTEIFDHLRVLYARAGRAHCAKCQLPLQALTPEGIVTQALDAFEGRSVSVLAPIVRDRKGQHKEIFESLARRGLIRARVDGDGGRVGQHGHARGAGPRGRRRERRQRRAYGEERRGRHRPRGARGGAVSAQRSGGGGMSFTVEYAFASG